MATERRPSTVSSLRRLRQLSDVLVLEVDPGLAADVVPTERSTAAAASSAPVRVLDVGEWEFGPAPPGASLGTLVLGGMIVLRVEFAGLSHLEVVGAGDILNPWLLGSETTLDEQVGVYVVRSGCVAVLDNRFASQMTPWPVVFASLMRRQTRRTRRMILQAAILSMPRVEDRLELMLWRLADQFGDMKREGLQVHLPFSHEQLGEIIGAQRPTVTLAVGRLAAEDRLRRPRRNEWLLPRHELERLTRRSRELSAQSEAM